MENPLKKWMIWGENPTIFGNIHMYISNPQLRCQGSPSPNGEVLGTQMTTTGDFWEAHIGLWDRIEHEHKETE